MTFTDTLLNGAVVVDPELLEDERGFFARTWCRREYASRGLNPNLAQCNISFSRIKGTLRGIHYQAEPYREAKLMRCTRGAIYDVVVDLRPSSPTFLGHFSTVLSAANRRMLYAAEGFGHGFLTLEDDTEVFYQMSEFYAPDYGRGIRWDDPAIGISWPAEVRVISDRDRSYPDFKLR